MELDEGFDCIWSVKNGLLLYDQIEEALDNAQLVIIPRVDNKDILTVVLLDQSIANDEIHVYRPGNSILRYKDLGDLEFKTEVRPGLRNLYFSALLAIFRRKRHSVPDYEHDFDKLRMSDNAVWAAPEKWMRRSIIRSLAAEIGDVFTEDVLNHIVGVGDMEHQESPEQESRRVAAMRYGLEYGIPEEDEEDEEDEEGY